MASQLPLTSPLQGLPLAMGKVHFLSAICRNELPGLRACHEAGAAAAAARQTNNCKTHLDMSETQNQSKVHLQTECIAIKVNGTAARVAVCVCV